MTLYNFTIIQNYVSKNYYIYTAVPIAPAREQITCTCDKYQQACITVLQVKMNKNDMLTQKQDTSNVNLVSLTVSRLGVDVQQLSISPNTNSESDFITANFLYTECVGDERFRVNITLSDECDRQSSPTVVECKPCEPKGISNIIIIAKT